MAQNRLNLNFKLETKEERVEFVRSYLNKILFTPTKEELDTIAKYILWGKDPKTGLNGRQEGLELETRYKTWDSQKVDSLESLFESQNFSEGMIRSPSNPPTKVSRQVFSRSAARKNAPSYILPILEELWRNIDETDLTINFYELAHQKRTLPPRPELLNRFTPDQITKIQTHASKLSNYAYLKLKHELVSLRREQYTLKDEYSPIIPSAPTFILHQSSPTFETEFTVLPIGIPSDTTFYKKIFNPNRYPNPNDFSQEDLNSLSKFLWTKKPQNKDRFFDFTDTSHLSELFKMWDILQEEAETHSIADSNLSLFLRAASMYRTLAALDPILDDILNLKIEKKSNQEILDIINPKYNKNYQPNYISTLYHQKCLGNIAAAAKRHREVLENIFFPENFKTCKDCGRILLLDEQNFMRQKRSKDGFSPRCKKCEKIIRERRKEQV